jgi:hypothetical protein
MKFIVVRWFLAISFSLLVCTLYAEPPREEPPEFIAFPGQNAIITWSGRPMGRQNELRYDASTWREREKAFSFEVLGLRPGTIVTFYGVRLADEMPEGLVEMGIYSARMENREVDGGPYLYADQLHLKLSRYAERFSTLVPHPELKCELLFVVMPNVAGVTTTTTSPTITRDTWPYASEIIALVRYSDPEAAKRKIEELKAKE